MRHWLITLALLAVFAVSCNLAKDTGETAEKGGQGAVSTAEKMKGGTVGDADMDSGESSADAEEGGY